MMRNLFLVSATAATVLTGLSVGGVAFAQGGSYQQTCRNTRSAGGSLTAECRDVQGNYRSSTLATGQCRGDIANNNGMLTCNGVLGSGGQIVGGGDNRGANNDRRDDNRRDDNRGGNNNAGSFAAGAVAGAIIGGVLGGPAPVYGDPHYGDPRYDPHYAQGGWGYGHRPGEWVSIRDRADWLERRIDRAQQQGRLNRRDARDLRRQLNSIEDLEGNYLRDGRLGGRERADLDHRFDDLSARIRFESDGPGYGGGDRGGDRDRDFRR